MVAISFSDLTQGDLTISIDRSFIGSIARADNSGERQLMVEIVRALRDTFAVRHAPLTEFLADASINLALDQFAPLGLKKKLVALPALRPELDPRDLPPFRAVQESEYEKLLDGLGKALRDQGWAEGPIRAADRDRLLNDVVAYFYKQLQELVALYRPGLLHVLIAYQEAITRELYSIQFSLPTRLACFADDPEMMHRLIREHSRASLANTANRFLIEYVTARPPEGNLNPSLESYDRLLALAAQIVEMGMLSDYLHFQIIEVSLSILPSGRLGREHEAFTEASELFANQYMFGEVRRSTNLFNSYFKTPTPTSAAVPRLAQMLDEGFTEEWGISLSDSRRLQARLFEIGTSQDGPVKSVVRAELINWVTAAWGWNTDKIELAIRTSALGPRNDFFVYQGESRAEVYAAQNPS